MSVDPGTARPAGGPRRPAAADSGGAVPLRHWSAAARSRVEAELVAVLEAWQTAWGLGGRLVPPGRRCTVWEEADAPAGGGAGGAMALAQLSRALVGEDVGAAGAGRAEDGTLGQELVRTAWEDLDRRLSTAFDGELLGVDGGGASRRRRWSGTLLAGIPWGDLELRLRIGCAAVERLSGGHEGRAPRAQPRPVGSVWRAVGERHVTVVVRLQPVELDLGSFASLGPGDVLRTGHGLERPLALELRASLDQAPAPVCEGFLGKVAGARALELVSTGEPGETERNPQRGDASKEPAIMERTSSSATPSAQPIALSELTPPRDDDGRPVVAAGGDATNPLRNVRVRVTVSLGGTELTIGELLAARAQQVLRLDQGIDDPVEVLLEGQVVARGTLVAVDDAFGVRITEVPTALELPLGDSRKAG